MKEPDRGLPAVEQEERRRCFWSVYLLDRLVSCGKDRHPVLLDDSCSVQLPCSEGSFRAGHLESTATIQQLSDWNHNLDTLKGNFPPAILAASILGRCARIVFHERRVDDLSPWDPRSEYVSLNSLLLLLESRAWIVTETISDVINAARAQDGTIDHQIADHGIFARTAFHLCHCLLNHPFLLRMHLRKVTQSQPSRFLYLAFQRSYDHARSLVLILQEAKEAGGHLGASFYAYAACVAGGVLLLTQHAELRGQNTQRPEVVNAIGIVMEVLGEMSSFWNHASKMVRLTPGRR